jgi:dGTPase
VDFNADVTVTYRQSKEAAQLNYLRTELTSALIDDYISNVEMQWRLDIPLLSGVRLPDHLRRQVEILKYFIYYTVINSPKLNLIRYRAQEVIGTLFDILFHSDENNSFLPEDVGTLFFSYPESDEKNRARVISDFIANMTDQYALELYRVFKSSEPKSIFKPI